MMGSSQAMAHQQAFGRKQGGGVGSGFAILLAVPLPSLVSSTLARSAQETGRLSRPYGGPRTAHHLLLLPASAGRLLLSIKSWDCRVLVASSLPLPGCWLFAAGWYEGALPIHRFNVNTKPVLFFR